MNREGLIKTGFKIGHKRVKVAEDLQSTMQHHLLFPANAILTVSPGRRVSLPDTAACLMSARSWFRSPSWSRALSISKDVQVS